MALRPRFSRSTFLVVLAASNILTAAPKDEWPALPRYERMAVPADNPMTAAKVALGRQLFFDPRMSGEGTTACASCHRPDYGFTEGAASGGRVCPTLWNIGYQDKLFWDGTASALESAAAGMWRFELAPGKAWEQKLDMFAVDSAKAGAHKLRLGFTPSGGTLRWSNEVEITVVR